MGEIKDELYFKELLARYRQDQCSPAEIRELFAWIHAGGHSRELFKSMQHDFEDIFKNEPDTASVPNVVPNAKVIRFHTKKWLSVAAGVAVLALVATLAFYLFKKENSQDAIAKSTIEAPEKINKTKAPTLTLADGRVIELDSSVSGTIALQGNVRITKNANGQVLYVAGGSTAGEEIFYNTVTTPVGGIFNVVLPDGSLVWLNAGSSIHFPTAFTGKSREVSVSGEAYFEVAKNPLMPFRVTINESIEVEVLGTHFNIMAYANEPAVKTTLLEGSIRLKEGTQQMLLKPGQQATLSSAGVISVENDINTTHVLAWKYGLFDFDNDNLSAVMRQLTRWYDIDVIYPETVPQGHFTGSIRKQSTIGEVLKMLELAGDVRFSVVGNKVMIHEK